MELTNAQMSYINNEVKSIDYGEIVIKINATARDIDILTTKRQRLPKSDDNKKYKQG